MKTVLVLISYLTFISSTSGFMNFREFTATKLLECYSNRIDNRVTNDVINGQELPLPSSMETFVSLIERYEVKNPSMQATELIRKMFTCLRIDDLPDDSNFGWTGEKLNNFERVFFDIPKIAVCTLRDEDFSRDEQCALHFMLSHCVNDTLRGKDNEETIEDGVAKHPLEYGVVSLHSKWKHAIGLGKVLLGVLAGLSGNNQMDAADLYKKMNSFSEDTLNNIKVNRIHAVTIGDLISNYISTKAYYKKNQVEFLPNGLWNDASCTTEYTLENNNEKYLTYSLLRGAVDGLIIGRKLESNAQFYRNIKLSKILRMYYGPSGLVDDSDSQWKTGSRGDIQWCSRGRNLAAITTLREDITNYYKLFMGRGGLDSASEDIGDVLSYIQSTASSALFTDMEGEAGTECSGSDISQDRKYSTPFSIIPILDFSVTDQLKNFQIEVLGNLSVSFDVRPRGSSAGAFSHLKSMQTSRGLDTIANISGISGCPACFIRYYKRTSGSRRSEADVLDDLNQTLTEYVDQYDETQLSLNEPKSGVPSKVVLFFDYGSPVDDYRLRDALWEIERYFREVTILAIGNKKDSLSLLTRNDDTDVFTETNNAANFAVKLRTRIYKIPAEFQFRECYRSDRGSESENKQVGFIQMNKIQYWAMYPKYFLKSFRITLKFKAIDGAQIKVCFTRHYYRIMEDRSQSLDCKESSGDDIEFYVSNPCYKRNEYNCDPFYFSIEGKRPGMNPCESMKCKTPSDIQFEFQHEGISCNSANLFQISTLMLLFIQLFLFKKTLVCV